MNYRPTRILMACATIPWSMLHASQPHAVASLQSLSMNVIRSEQFLTHLQQNEDLKNQFDDLPADSIGFDTPALLKAQLRYAHSSEPRSRELWNSPMGRYVYGTQFDTYDLQNLTKSSCKKSTYPFSYTQQVATVGSTIYVITQVVDKHIRRHQPLKKNSSNDYSFVIHKLTQKDLFFSEDLPIITSKDTDNRWKRIHNTGDIEFLSLLPPDAGQEYPYILVWHTDGSCQKHDFNCNTLSPFMLPEYCTAHPNLTCVTDDRATGRYVVYEKKTDRFVLCDSKKRTKLPITDAAYMFFFDHARYLYVQTSYSTAYCIDVINNEIAERLSNCQLTALTEQYAISLQYCKTPEYNDTIQMYDLLCDTRADLTNTQLLEWYLEISSDRQTGVEQSDKRSTRCTRCCTLL